MYVDAARQSRGRYIICAVTGHGEPIIAAIVKTASALGAEEDAIVLAILDRVVVNFMMGFGGSIAANILKNTKHSNTIQSYGCSLMQEIWGMRLPTCSPKFNQLRGRPLSSGLSARRDYHV